MKQGQVIGKLSLALALLLSVLPFCGPLSFIPMGFLLMGSFPLAKVVALVWTLIPALSALISKSFIPWVVLCNRATFLVMIALWLRRKELSFVLTWLILVGLIFIVLLYQVIPGLTVVWQDFWFSAWAKVTPLWRVVSETEPKILATLGLPSGLFSDGTVTAYVKYLAQYSTGLWWWIYAGWDLIALSLVTYCHLLQTPAVTKGKDFFWKNFRLPLVVIASFALCLLVPNELFIARYSVLALFGLPIIGCGLSLCHWLFKVYYPSFRWGLTLVYLLWGFFPQVITVLLIVLASIDSAIDLRKRLMKEVYYNGSHSIRKNS